jgi:hypothetical protein
LFGAALLASCRAVDRLEAGMTEMDLNCAICGQPWDSGVDAMLIHICACFSKCSAQENEVLEFLFEARGYLGEDGMMTPEAREKARKYLERQRELEKKATR